MWQTTIKCAYAECFNHQVPVPVQAPGQLPTSGWVVVKRTKIQLNALRDKAPRRVEVMEAFCSVACAVNHLASEVGIAVGREAPSHEGRQVSSTKQSASN
jgi:hypothetical protein